MKNKLIFLCAALAVLLLTIVFQTTDHADLNSRELQHTEPLPEEAAPEGGTHLPIISIDTGGQKVPGAPISGGGGKGMAFETGDNGETDIPVGFTVYSQDGGWNTTRSEPAFDGRALIRYRGNSSRRFDKKSYAVHLINQDGDYVNRSLLGLPAANEWVLNGPFLDRTLIRNYLCYNVAGQVMPYAPRVRFVELYVDGAYTGLYLLVESITMDPGRVELTKPKNEAVLTSWIVEMDRDYKAAHLLDSYAYYTLQMGISGFDMRYPGKNTITEERFRFVQTDVSEVERTLYSLDADDPVEGYAADLDVRAFAQYFVLNEFFGNRDAGHFSTYYYRDVRGKVTPVVWDFNDACDNDFSSIHNGEGFFIVSRPWFDALVTHKDFVDEVVRQYRFLRKSVLSDQYLLGFIDDTVAYLGDEVDRNYEVWGYVFDLENICIEELQEEDKDNYLTPAERNYTSYGEAVAQLKDWLTRRSRWLDDNIASLYQYCQSSRNAENRLG